jgi:asparagine synthase (glutamine-hydrolysing)
MEWGVMAVQKFIGMFAFVIYDLNKNQILLFRDRAGVKPLYYYWNHSDLFLFGSELKAFHEHPRFQKEIEMKAVAQFLQRSWIAAPHTIFKNTFKVKPGHFISFNLSKKEMEETKYWDVIDYYNKPTLKITEQDAQEEVKKLLISACEYRMVSDVPVGIFLSGGYDSSAVAAILQTNRTEKLKTFTIGFEDAKYNEAIHAKKVADHLGTDHTEKYCSYKEAIELIERIPFYYDEPFADSSALPTMLVSKLAVEKVKVSLSADGGDEIFAGYGRYSSKIDDFLLFANIPFPLNQLMSIPFSGAEYLSRNLKKPFLQYKLEKLKKVLQSRHPLDRYRYRIEPRNFTSFELNKLLKGKLVQSKTSYDELNLLRANIDYVNAFMAIEFKTTLVDDILVKVDRATMSYGLEGREPMLDHRLAEFSAQLPAAYKINNGVQKQILKNIVHQYIPREIMERPKMGFGIPTGEWLSAELKPLVLYHLSEEQINKFGILNAQYVKKLLNDFFAGNEINPERIWILLMLQMWLAKWN